MAVTDGVVLLVTRGQFYSGSESLCGSPSHLMTVSVKVVTGVILLVTYPVVQAVAVGFTPISRGQSRPLISFYLQRTWFCPLLDNCPLRTGLSAFCLNLCLIII